MSTISGVAYGDLSSLAAGRRTNLKKRVVTGDEIAPNPKRPKIGEGTISSVSKTISAPFLPPVSGIRNGTAAQLAQQLASIHGNVPDMAYAHTPIHTIDPKFLPSKLLYQNAEAGELTLAFNLESRQRSSSPFSMGGGLRLINYQLVQLTLDLKSALKEGFESSVADMRLNDLGNPDHVASLCNYLGPVYIPDNGIPKSLKKGAEGPTELVVQVLGLAEGPCMKDIWPEAPVGSQLYLELRRVKFDKHTVFQITKKVTLEPGLFPNERPKWVYQIVPTFVPPNLEDYMASLQAKSNPAYSNPHSWRVPIGKLLRREKGPKHAAKLKTTPAQLGRGINWNSCDSIKVFLSSCSYWRRTSDADADESESEGEESGEDDDGDKDKDSSDNSDSGSDSDEEGGSKRKGAAKGGEVSKVSANARPTHASNDEDAMDEDDPTSVFN